MGEVRKADRYRVGDNRSGYYQYYKSEADLARDIKAGRVVRSGTKLVRKYPRGYFGFGFPRYVTGNGDYDITEIDVMTDFEPPRIPGKLYPPAPPPTPKVPKGPKDPDSKKGGGRWILPGFGPDQPSDYLDFYGKGPRRKFVTDSNQFTAGPGMQLGPMLPMPGPKPIGGFPGVPVVPADVHPSAASAGGYFGGDDPHYFDEFRSPRRRRKRRRY